MEILRFEEAPTGAPKRKKSSRSFLALGLVATLFGISTAFASSTIQINGPSNVVALGQGVAAVLGCDPDVVITPDAGLTTATVASSSATPSPTAPAPTFNLSKITVSGIDTADTDAETGLGCGGVDFKLQVFHTVSPSAGAKKEEAYICSDLGTADIGTSSGDYVPSKIDCQTDAIYFRVKTDKPGKINGTVEIILNGSSDIDYITLVSTNYAAFDI